MEATKRPSDSGMACCGVALSSAIIQLTLQQQAGARVDEPQEALSKASCGIVPRDSHQERPFTLLDYILWKQNTKKGIC